MTSASTGATAVGGPEDRSPVNAPEGVIAELRVAPPRAIVHALKAYLPKLGAKLDARSLIASNFGDIAQLVDVDGPIDAIAVRSEKGLESTAVGFALGFDESSDLASGAIGKSYSVKATAGGVRLLVPKGIPAQEAEELTTCGIFPSRGPSAHRVVCVLNKGLAIVAPYLARGITEKPALTTTAHLEVDAKSLRGALGSMLDVGRKELAKELAHSLVLGAPKLDALTTKLAGAITTDLADFVGDADAIAIDANLDPTAVSLKAHVVLADRKSWLARALTLQDEHASSAALEKLPGDGIFAVGANGYDAESDALMAPIQAALLDGVAALAADFAWSKKDLDAATVLAKSLFPKSASSYFAIGRMHPEPTPKYDTDDPFERLVEQPLWGIVESDRPVKHAVDFVTALGTVGGSQAVKKTVEAIYKGNVKLDNQSITSTAKKKGDAPLTTTSLIYTVTPKKELGIKPITLTFDEAVAGSDTQSWCAFSLNGSPEEARNKLAAAQKGSASPSLAGSAALAALSNGPWGMAIAASLEGIARLAADPHDVNEALLELPDAGKGFFGLAISSKVESKGSSADIALSLPRDAVYVLAMF